MGSIRDLQGLGSKGSSWRFMCRFKVGIEVGQVYL